MKFKVLALASWLWVLPGCQSHPPLTAETSTPAAPQAAVQADWFAYFAEDASFSLRFPKAPEAIGKDPNSRVLVAPLDKRGSNLSLLQMALPEGFSLQKLEKDPESLFGKEVKMVASQPLKVQGREALQVELLAGSNRCWVRLILAPPYLYQLVALQAADSPIDYASERQTFFDSFAFTKK